MGARFLWGILKKSPTPLKTFNAVYRMGEVGMFPPLFCLGGEFVASKQTE